jgi:hypothetical protein
MRRRDRRQRDPWIDRSPRPYINAEPFYPHSVHWPTEEEMDALTEAERRVWALEQRIGPRERPHRVAIQVADGLGHRAVVFLGGVGDWMSFIDADNEFAIGGVTHLKAWMGVPKWARAPVPAEHHHHHHHHHPHGGEAMRRRYPDHHVPGDQINVVVPEPRFVDARQHVHVRHGAVVHHHHAAPEHIHHGAPAVQDVHIGQIEVRVQRRRSFWANLFIGPDPNAEPAPQYQQTPQITQQQEIDMGQIYGEAVPYDEAPPVQPYQALPAPQHVPQPAPQYRELPAPQQSAPRRPQQAGQPLGIAYQPEQPMSTAAAAFNSNAKVRR